MGSSQCPPETDNLLPLNISVESWLLAEKTTDCIIRKIQPTEVSEERRKNVIEYIQKLVRGCLGYEIYPFGSVPLVTYLPDGDIDLTALGPPNSEDFLSSNVRAVLEAEEWNNDSKFKVKDVQCIQAEVKLVKCLVQNVVVDISFNSIGGLCTLCFLDEVDNMIGKHHLFKRTIILIKAWCYYESRILGAHHNLISTYALETLILYIFHLFHSYLDEPLMVLFRFLDYFSKFDWANLCVSLRGPVLLSSLPEIVVEVPETDGDNLLFSSDFLDQCGEKYSVHYRASENNRFFVKKYINIVDPLRENNNLGRSVSKGNLYRIRSAFAYGARKLGKILLSKENMPAELENFFKNTLERHGNGGRPDVQDLNPQFPIDMTNTNQSEGSNGSIDDLCDTVIISNHEKYHIEKESEFKDKNTVLGSHMIDSNSRFENEVSLPSPTRAICTSHLHSSNGQIVVENGNTKEMSASISNCLDSSLSISGKTESSVDITKICSSNLRSSSSDITCEGKISHVEGNEDSSLFVECVQDIFDVADLAGNHEVHLNNLRYAQCSYDFMNKSLSLGNVTPYPQYPSIHGKMIRSPVNGFFSGPPFPSFIPMNQCFVPRPLGLDDMRNQHRGTGTYIPLMNQNGISENPTTRRLRNHQFPSNQSARSQNVGRAVPLREYNMTDVGCFSVFNGNGRGNYGQMDHHRVSSGPFSSRFPIANDNNHPLENQVKFGSLDATCLDSPTMGNGGKIESNSPSHIHSPGSAISNLTLSQRSEISPNSERSMQSYHLKDDEEFPPLSGGGNQTALTQLTETKSAWEASRR